jgi:hypothetical protein
MHFMRQEDSCGRGHLHCQAECASQGKDRATYWIWRIGESSSKAANPGLHM